jgi:hypothetical protein
MPRPIRASAFAAGLALLVVARFSFAGGGTSASSSPNPSSDAPKSGKGSGPFARSPNAATPDKFACIAAADSYQDLRKARRLSAARKQLDLCSSKSCPGQIVADCTEWREELRKATPSIIVTLDTGFRGLPSVSVDGKPLEESELIAAIELDPGRHTVIVLSEDRQAERTFLLAEGEKLKQVRFAPADFQSKPSVTTDTAGVEAPSHSNARAGPGFSTSQSDAQTKSGAGALPWIIGGAGVALILAGGVFLGVGASRYGSLKDSPCGKARTCTDDDVSSIRTNYNVGYVLGGIGLAAIATAAIIYVVYNVNGKATTQAITGLFGRDLRF